MTNKARNIYIDTTGFCEDALRRVDKALSVLPPGRFRRRGCTYFYWPAKALDKDGFPIGRNSAGEFQLYGDIANLRQVWLWELESLAGIR